MKQVFVLFLIAAIGCNNAPEKEALSMGGAYSLLSQNVKNDKIDTTYAGLKQLKIFTGDFVMYANINPADSASSFGAGHYMVNMDTVAETIVYSSGGNGFSDSASTFKLIIEKTAKGYKQVIPEIGSDTAKFKLTEEYETVSTTSTSALDGLWKMTKSINITGKDTSISTNTQYKMYGSGHFIFGNTWADSTNKSHTGIGFGTFTMNGTSKVKESVTASTYYQVRGQSFDIDIEMTGTDEFKQTLTYPDGSKGIEIYQRVKK